MASRALAIRNRALCLRNRAWLLGCCPSALAAIAICGSFNDSFGGIPSQGVATCDGIASDSVWTSHPGLAGIRNKVLFTADGRLVCVGRFFVGDSAPLVYMAAIKTIGGQWEPLGQPINPGESATTVHEFRSGWGNLLLIGGTFTIGGHKNLAYLWDGLWRPIPFDVQYLDPLMFPTVGPTETPQSAVMASAVNAISANEVYPIIVPGQAHGPIAVAGGMSIAYTGSYFSGTRRMGGHLSIEVPRTPAPFGSGAPAWLDNPKWIDDSAVIGGPGGAQASRNVTNPTVAPVGRRVVYGSHPSASNFARALRKAYSAPSPSWNYVYDFGQSSIFQTMGTRLTGDGAGVYLPITPITSGTQHGNFQSGATLITTDGTDIYLGFPGLTTVSGAPGLGSWRVWRQNTSGGVDFAEGVSTNLAAGEGIQDLDASDRRLYLLVSLPGASQYVVRVRATDGSFTNPGAVTLSGFVSSIAAPRA